MKYCACGHRWCEARRMCKGAAERFVWDWDLPDRHVCAGERPEVCWPWGVEAGAAEILSTVLSNYERMVRAAEVPTRFSLDPRRDGQWR